MSKIKKKKRRAWKVICLIFLILLLLLGCAVLIGINVFTVEKVTVDGTDRYSDRMIEDWVLNDEYSWNTLYVYLKYQQQEPESIPFIDTMDISIVDPHTIHIQVYEKELQGYIYLDKYGQNAYFDRDGYVVETSSELVDGLPQITGLDIESVVLYEKLPVKETGALRHLTNLTQILKLHEVIPISITYGEDRTYTLNYGEIQVLLGTAGEFNEKVLRMIQILPQLEGMGGVLHMESWTAENSDISFEKWE